LFKFNQKINLLITLLKTIPKLTNKKEKQISSLFIARNRPREKNGPRAHSRTACPTHQTYPRPGLGNHSPGLCILLLLGDAKINRNYKIYILFTIWEQPRKLIRSTTSSRAPACPTLQATSWAWAGKEIRLPGLCYGPVDQIHSIQSNRCTCFS
jgi:hypothetical protein